VTPWRGFLRADGRGLRVAVIDSGITPGHPHVGEVAEGVFFALGPGRTVVQGDDFLDRIGHGTACAGVIRKLLPRAEILAVRVFARSLEADAQAVAAGIRWAAGRGASIVNLSLAALPGGGGARALLLACRAAARAGAVLVAARPPRGFPGGAGALARRPEVILAGADPGCPPDRLRLAPGRRGLFLASPYARPIPGVAPRVNFNGPSLAAARLTGFAGKALHWLGPLSAALLRAALRDWARHGEGPALPAHLGRDAARQLHR